MYQFQTQLRVSDYLFSLICIFYLIMLHVTHASTRCEQFIHKCELNKQLCTKMYGKRYFTANDDGWFCVNQYEMICFFFFKFNERNGTANDHYMHHEILAAMQ